MKKKILAITMALVLTFAGAIPAMAATVYYKGDAVHWDYGRKLAIISFSTVNTSVYTHSASANGKWSGWVKKGKTAHAEKVVGIKKATAAWNCK